MNKKNTKFGYYNHFPLLLREIMKESNTTQQQLAEYINVRRQTVSAYINGETTPDINMFSKIIDFFNKEKRV